MKIQLKAHQITEHVSGLLHSGYDPFTQKAFKMVYQKVRKGLGNVQHDDRDDLQLRIQVPIRDKKSPAQLQSRARIKAATEAWQALDENQKTTYRQYAEFKQMTGFNLFIRNYCQLHPVTEF